VPGKTLGGVYLSLRVRFSARVQRVDCIAALVGYRQIRWLGFHIYVDNPDSIAGGREIWGLPKEMAEFTWEKASALLSVKETGCVHSTTTAKASLRVATVVGRQFQYFRF